MTGYRELLEDEVIGAWRTHRIVLVCALYVVLGIASPLIVRFLPELQGVLGTVDEELGFGETGLPDALDLLVRNVVQFGSIAAVLLAMGSVAGERERGTIRQVLARPVSRTAFLAAKFFSLAMILGLATGLGVLAAYLYSNLLFGATELLAWAQSALFLLLAVLVPAAITFLGSTLARSSLGAAAFGIAGLVVLSLGSTLPTASPFFSTGLAELARAMPIEGVGPDLDPGRTVGVAIGIVVTSLALAWLRFRQADV